MKLIPTPNREPLFPVWEFVAVAYICFYSTMGLILGQIRPVITELLGTSWGLILWLIGLFFGSAACLISMFLKPPNGLVVNLAGSMTIFLLSFSVAVGLALSEGTFFFRGNAGLWVFALGGLLKSLQLFNTLSRLEKTIKRL